MKLKDILNEDKKYTKSQLTRWVAGAILDDYWNWHTRIIEEIERDHKIDLGPQSNDIIKIIDVVIGNFYKRLKRLKGKK